MAEREEYLQSLVEKAKAGSSDALSELSLIALGGNKTAQSAVRDIDRLPQNQSSSQAEVVKSIVWPSDVEKGLRGPIQGDVALHNDL